MARNRNLYEKNEQFLESILSPIEHKAEWYDAVQFVRLCHSAEAKDDKICFKFQNLVSYMYEIFEKEKEAPLLHIKDKVNAKYCDNFDKIYKAVKEYTRIESGKCPQKKSPSQWFLEDFISIFSNGNVDLENLLKMDWKFRPVQPKFMDPHFKIPKQEIDHLINNVLEPVFKTTGILGGYPDDCTHLARIHSQYVNEGLTRSFVNPVLAFLVNHLNKINPGNGRFTLHHEFKIYNKTEVNPILDYCIAYGDEIIGCVELKSPKGLCQKSMIQLLLQLLTIAMTYKDPPQNKKIIGILTDGYKFVVVVFYLDKFYIQSKSPDCIVHFARNWGELHYVLDLITASFLYALK